MKLKKLDLPLYMTIILGLCVVFPRPGLSQILPGPADVGRIKPQQEEIIPRPAKDSGVTVPESALPLMQAPAGAKGIHLILKGVSFEGVTAFKPDALKEIYAAYIGRNVTMDIAWQMASQLTKCYRESGYFLSQAYVPEQKIHDGTITIRVVEGYVGQVDLDDPVIAKHSIVKALIKRLLARKPVRAADIEDFLLRLNDLPGLSFRSVLSPLDVTGKKKGAIKITLIPAAEKNSGAISFDNFGSRFLGPHESTLTYQASFLPLQKTDISLLSVIPLQKLYSASFKHTVLLSPDISLALSGGVTKANPGYSLKPLEVESRSTSAGLTVNYQPLRQRKHNLVFRIGLDGRDTKSDIVAGALTRERTRALRMGMNYANTQDDWAGQNVVDLSLSRGVSLLDASKKDDPDLSRAKAVPHFTKLNLSLSHLQSITNNWSAIATLSGQGTSDTLYSSEEFGYGGQAFGRAYDESEMIGDRGVAGSLEVRYSGLTSTHNFYALPYMFYDVGKIWSEVAGESAVSGSSTGLGFHFSTPIKVEGMAALAFPLTKPIANPIYGASKEGPRLLFQASKLF